MQSQVVGLMREVEHWKKQATTLEGEKQGNSGNADKLGKEVEKLKDQVSSFCFFTKISLKVPPSTHCQLNVSHLYLTSSLKAIAHISLNSDSLKEICDRLGDEKRIGM